MSAPPTDYAALREVFEAARKAVGLREGCTYDAVIERVASLEAELAEARRNADAAYEAAGDKAALAEYEFQRAERAETALRGVKLWFDTRPWEGTPDGSAHGGGTRDYSENERTLGYGTYRDPRHLPAALAVSSASEAETERGTVADKAALRPARTGEGELTAEDNSPAPRSVSASEPDGETACPACGDSYSQPHWCPVTAIAENPCARCGREIGTDKVRLCRECAEVIAEPDGETS